MAAAIAGGESALFAAESFDEDLFLKEVDRHRFGPLLYFYGNRQPRPFPWPERILTALKARAAAECFRESMRKRALEELFRILHEAGLDFLVFKGTALAYAHYPEPYLRPRCDTDLLIRKEEVVKVRTVLVKAGYDFVPSPTGEHVSHQFVAERSDAYGFLHVYDFHWDLCTPAAFSGLFRFDELKNESKKLPFPHPAPRMPGDRHALLISCVHRVAHHYDTDHLLWFFDIHLLLKNRDKKWLAGFWDLAAAKGAALVCRAGIEGAEKWFKTPAAGSISAWQVPEKMIKDRPSAVFFKARPRLLDLIVSDLGALPTWRQKILCLREHLFPSPDYLLKKYSSDNRFLLPFFYVKRLLSGFGKLFAPLKREVEE